MHLFFSFQGIIFRLLIKVNLENDIHLIIYYKELEQLDSLDGLDRPDGTDKLERYLLFPTP